MGVSHTRLGGLYRQPTVIALVSLLILWQVVSLYFRPRDFPGLLHLAELIYIVLSGADRYYFPEHAWISLQRITIAAIISLGLGMTVGIAMGYARVERYFTAPLMIVLTFPSVVWAFIAVMWFGITTYLVMVLVIVLIVAPYIAVNVWKGAEAIDPDLIEMANAFDASMPMTWRHVFIPFLMPFFFSSARMALALSWKLSLVAEIFGASSGLGFVINVYYESQRADMIIAWAVPVMLLMFGIERLIKRSQERYFLWRPEVGGVDTEVQLE